MSSKSSRAKKQNIFITSSQNEAIVTIAKKIAKTSHFDTKQCRPVVIDEVEMSLVLDLGLQFSKHFREAIIKSCDIFVIGVVSKDDIKQFLDIKDFIDKHFGQDSKIAHRIIITPMSDSFKSDLCLGTAAERGINTCPTLDSIADKIKQVHRKNKETDTKTMSSTNIVVYGDAFVGKTTVINKMIGEKYINFTSTKELIKRSAMLKVKGKEYAVVMHDTPGTFREIATFKKKQKDDAILEEIMQQNLAFMHAHALMAMHLAIVVYDTTKPKSYKYAFRMVELLKKHCPQTKICCIANKIDLATKYGIQYLTDFPKDVIFVRASLREFTDFEINNLLTRIMITIKPEILPQLKIRGVFDIAGTVHVGEKKVKKSFVRIEKCCIVYADSEKDIPKKGTTIKIKHTFKVANVSTAKENLIKVTDTSFVLMFKFKTVDDMQLWKACIEENVLIQTIQREMMKAIFGDCLKQALAQASNKVGYTPA